jgi:hypothetical protein
MSMTRASRDISLPTLLYEWRGNLSIFEVVKKIQHRHLSKRELGISRILRAERPCRMIRGIYRSPRGKRPRIFQTARWCMR